MGGKAFQDAVQIRSLDDRLPDQAGTNRDQPKGGVQDNSGQPHPAARGMEQVGSFRRGCLHAIPVAQEDFHARYMFTKGAVDVMILPMDIARDRPADRDKPGARSHRQEPAPGHENAKDLIQGYSGFAGHDSRVRIEGQEAIASPGLDHPVRETAVPVTAAQAECDVRSGSRHRRGNIMTRSGAHHVCVHFRISPPAMNDHGLQYSRSMGPIRRHSRPVPDIQRGACGLPMGAGAGGVQRASPRACRMGAKHMRTCGEAAGRRAAGRLPRNHYRDRNPVRFRRVSIRRP